MTDRFRWGTIGVVLLDSEAAQRARSSAGAVEIPLTRRRHVDHARLTVHACRG